MGRVFALCVLSGETRTSERKGNRWRKINLKSPRCGRRALGPSPRSTMASMASFLSSSRSLFSHSSTGVFTLAPITLVRKPPTRTTPWIKAASSAEPEKEKLVQTPTGAPPSPASPPRPKKPEYSMKKGQIVRVDKEKYLNSINYLSVGHPPHYKGLDYIYEDRGEVAWVGIPTPPAWLPTNMLIKKPTESLENFPFQLLQSPPSQPLPNVLLFCNLLNQGR
ncbi:uncharacterized protein [Elaeis guineensis]|uniref:uncharacterized protein isoform X2 n=1 Tax=Elaeis guineensis var. tenera TaxID=51953 RepID=UPI003C6D7C3D